MQSYPAPPQFGPTLLALWSLALLAPGAGAAPPPPPWTSQNLGATPQSGTTDVDENGIWTLRSDGYGFSGGADQFHFVYQRLQGDGSLSARFLGLTAPLPRAESAAFGLMVRVNDTIFSPALACLMTLYGLYGRVRPDLNSGTSEIPLIGPPNVVPNLWLRLQRVGAEVAMFYSLDGQLWSEAYAEPVTLSDLGQESLVGLAGGGGAGASATFDQIQVQPGALSVYGLQACGGAPGVPGNGPAVLLQWRPVPNALGYNIYRIDASQRLVKFNRAPVADTSYTDNTADLTNGKPETYVVAPVLPGADGKPAEGLRVTVAATPGPAPPGFVGCAINNDPAHRTGSSTQDQATGEIALRGSGFGSWWQDDLYFVGQAVEGDVQITARLRAVSGEGKPAAGLMIRESLGPAPRMVSVWRSPGVGLTAQRRRGPDWLAAENGMILEDAVRLPILLRLTRQGNTILPEYSSDDGRTFMPLGKAVTFDPPLAKNLYVGLAASSGDHGSTAEATFRDLIIRKL
jgi:regulation of enolase protein 1 (concanavalin A-like superfamily)